jgi:kynureninase
MEEDLLALRAEFPSLARGVHLVSHSLGAMPARARELSARFVDEWEAASIGAWHERWLPAVRELSDLVARVLGVAPGSVCMLPNVSIAQATVASCLSFQGRRNKVVYDDLNFSTVHYVWREQTRRGAEVVVVPSDGVHPPLEGLLDAIDERTLVVPISHVAFRSSGLIDAARVIERAHAVGAMVLLDVYQSAGTVPLSLGEWGCDMACGGSVKWACGGPGAAFLYVRPDLRPKLEPMATGWFSHAEPFAFDMGSMRWADDAWRFAGGTPPVPSMYSARAGWEVIAGLDAHSVRAKSLRQTSLLRTLVEARGLRVNTPEGDDERGGMICIDFAGADLVSKRLLERRIFQDYRPRCGIRVSPHFYTTDDELEELVFAIDELRAAPPR